MTRKQQILSYLLSNPSPVCDDCLSSSTRCFPRQHVNQICRTLREQHQISRYQGLCSICSRNKIVNQITTGNIVGASVNTRDIAHMVEPAITSSLPSEKDSQFTISPISFAWKPILADGNVPYQFPDEITSFMRSSYHFSAIYRWIIESPDNDILYYIGETEQLCPRRIGHYLKPGPSQETNKRLNELFLSYIQKGCRIHMDYLVFDSFSLNSIPVNQNSLDNKNARRMIEHLIIFLYQEQGISLLNR